jgi:CMP-N,N'-diacetyllegionaminic acid synthase
VPDPKRTLIVIPARGGSKRLPRKNVLPLGGKPLILHAVDAALAAAPFGKVMVSTDDPEIKTVALSRSGASVDDRAITLAGDKIKVVDVISDLLDRPEIQSDFDVVGMLLPTCPFRTPTQLKEAFDALDKEVDASITFTTYEFPPQMAVGFGNDQIMKPIFEPCPLITGNTRSQDQEMVYRPNGAVFFTWVESFRRLRSFYTGRVKGTIMPRLNSVDIDDGPDFAYAQYLVDSGQIAVTP